MNRTRYLAYAIMPGIFLLAFSPLAVFGYTKTPASIFPTPEQQAFLKANPAKVLAKVEAEKPRKSAAKRPQLVVSISTTHLVVGKCTEDTPKVTATALAETP